MAKTIVGELVDLYVKYGGSRADLTGKETTAEMIDAIEQIYHDNGDTLPTVTSDDNGKVLSVVNGEWDKANVPAELPAVTAEDNGKVLMVVNGEWDAAEIESNDFLVSYSEDNGEYSCDKTFSQVAVAVQANKNVRAKLGGDFYNLVSLDTNTGVVTFSQVTLDVTNNPVLKQIAHDTTNDIQFNVVPLMQS